MSTFWDDCVGHVSGGVSGVVESQFARCGDGVWVYLFGFISGMMMICMWSSSVLILALVLAWFMMLIANFMLFLVAVDLLLWIAFWR